MEMSKEVKMEKYGLRYIHKRLENHAKETKDFDLSQALCEMVDEMIKLRLRISGLEFIVEGKKDDSEVF